MSSFTTIDAQGAPHAEENLLLNDQGRSPQDINDHSYLVIPVYLKLEQVLPAGWFERNGFDPQPSP